MGILANVLVLGLIAADEPKPPAKVGEQAPVVQQPIATGATMPKVPKPRTSDNPEPEEIWHLPLPEAIRIGLDNSEVIRVIALTGPTDSAKEKRAVPRVLISQLNADVSIGNFKSSVMAHVRSIEQQYWALSASQINLWARETAVKLGEEILRRERAELEEGRSNRAEVAEAEQQLENFKLYLVTATSDLITTERQLRNILGLPPTDGRRIVPDTAPTEAKLSPNWKQSLGAMHLFQPDIVQQRQLVLVSELAVTLDGNDQPISAERRETLKKQVERQRAFLEQIQHQTTHSLARFFLEIDANYKQLQAARSARESAQKRLETQRKLHEEGRITTDRLLDAVAQYANAIAQEAMYKSSYNTSIAAFEEAQGTLLSRDGIIIVDSPDPERLFQPRDTNLAPASFTMPAPAPAPSPAPVAPAKPQPTSTTYKLRAKLGLVKVLDVEFEVCPGSK
jgi:hypothetical protein